MERHAFLRAQEWLLRLPNDGDGSAGSPAADNASAAAAGSSARPAVTAFVGAASLHFSPAEQSPQATQFSGKTSDMTHISVLEPCLAPERRGAGTASSQHGSPPLLTPTTCVAILHLTFPSSKHPPTALPCAGPLAADAVHLSFAAAAAASGQEDPMQLRLQVDVALQRAADAGGSQPQQPPQQQMQLMLHLDSTQYQLDLRYAARLVAAPQLAPLLLPLAQAGGVAQQQHEGQQEDDTAAGFLAFAQPGAAALPFLTLIFTDACCLNIYPLGWKAAAAHVSKVGGVPSTDCTRCCQRGSSGFPARHIPLLPEH